MRRLVPGVFDDSHLSEDGLHLGFELRGPRRHRGDVFVDRLECPAVGAKLVA